MSQTTAILFIVFGLLALAMAIIVLVFYIFKRKKQIKEGQDFKIKRKGMRNDIYSFWINYVFIFLIAVGIIATIILVPIGISELVK